MKLLVFFLLLPCFFVGQPALMDVEKMLEQKQFSNAETKMLHYVKAHPNDLKGIELLGDTYGLQMKWDAAIEHYKRLVDANSKIANYHYKYGGAMSMKLLEVNKWTALGMIGDVKSAFLNAVELDPNHINAHWALVKLYMQLPGILGGSKRKALKYADELEALSKVDGYLAKGYIYAYDNDYGLAESYFKNAVASGGSKTCYRELIQFYLDNRHHEKALFYLKEAYGIYRADEFLQQMNALQKQD